MNTTDTEPASADSVKPVPDRKSGKAAAVSQGQVQPAIKLPAAANQAPTKTSGMNTTDTEPASADSVIPIVNSSPVGNSVMDELQTTPTTVKNIVILMC